MNQQNTSDSANEYRHETIAQEFKIPFRYAKRIKLMCDAKLKIIRETIGDEKDVVK